VRILYGVCGEGMGHAMRSAVVAQHLIACGHDVRFVSSGGAHRYLDRRWPGRVTYVLGLRSVVVSNKIRPATTLLANVAKQTAGPLMHVGSFLALMTQARPDVVISDFDPWTANYASMRGVPVVAVDNCHFMTRCTHPQEVIAPDRTAAAIAFPPVNRMVSGARQYLVTTFVGAPVCARATTLHHPILRREVIAARPTIGTHVCAYFNESSDHQAIARALHGVAANFRVYGAPGVTRDTIAGNVLFRPFSEGTFVRDLASSTAVLGGAGFTLMTEAIALGKPMLAAPFEGYFEQILNANYLQLIGYGERARTFDSATVAGFLDRAPAYRARLAGFRHDGNVGLLGAVEAAIRGA
jgi:uncharacterized protein (TIGR00661 family)